MLNKFLKVIGLKKEILMIDKLELKSIDPISGSQQGYIKKSHTEYIWIWDKRNKKGDIK